MVFHGNARNARTYRDYAQALADRHCLLLVAPLSDRRDFPAWRYQRGGIVKDGVVQNPQDWTGMLVPALADWVRQQEGRPLARKRCSLPHNWATHLRSESTGDQDGRIAGA